MADENKPNNPPAQDQKKPDEWRNVEDVKKLFKERDEQNVKLRELSSELDKYRQADTARATREKEAAEAAERERLEQAGKYKEALEGVEKKYKAELESVTSAIHKQFVPAIIKAAAAKVENMAQEAIDDLPELLARFIRLDAKTLQPVVLDDKGKPALDEHLQPVSVETFVANFVKGKPYLLTDKMPAGNNKPDQRAGHAAMTYEEAMQRGVKALRELEKADPAAYAAAKEAYFSPEARRERAKRAYKPQV